MRKFIIAGLALLMLVPSVALAQHRPGGGGHRDGGSFHRPGGGGNFHRPSGGWHRPSGGWHRPGGWWGPRYHDGGDIGGAIAGTIIGGAISNWLFRPQPEVVVVPQEPVRDITWCQQRYRSYDVYTRTYLGYDGLRHACP